MGRKKDDDNIISFQAEIKRLKDIIEAKNEISDIQTTKSIYNTRLLAEQKDDQLRRMNNSYAFIHSVGSKPMILAKVYNEYYKREINEFITPESIIIRHANEVAESIDLKGMDKNMPLGKWWLGHMHRKEYATVTFEPDRPPGEYAANNGKLYFNMWEGFAVPPKKGNWGLTQRHIYKILCNRNADKFKYVMRWFAWAVQHPDRQAEVAIIFKGKKGAGKSFIFTQMVKIFGIHAITISSREHLTGKHNEHLQNKSFLFADEAYYPGDKEAEGVLKSIITESTLTTEPKFRGVKLNNNCLHIGMATNSEWVIPASEDERRYFINTVDDTYTKGKSPNHVIEKYFRRLWAEMNNDGLSAMLYDLLNMDIEGWHPRHNIPVTEELRNQIELSLPYVKRAMLHLLENGTFPGTIDSQGRYIISNANLIKYFQTIDNRYKNITFKVVAGLCKDLKIQTDRTGSIGRFYIFPELEEIRNMWENITSNRMGWNIEEKWIVQTKEYGI